MERKNKNYVLYIVPFILLVIFLYLTFTTNKSLGEGKVFFIIVAVLMTIICFAIIGVLILSPIVKKIESNIENNGYMGKAQVVKATIKGSSEFHPYAPSFEMTDYNNQSICTTAQYEIVLEFKNDKGKTIRRKHNQFLNRLELSYLINKGDIDVKIFGNSCILKEEIPALAEYKDILTLESEITIKNGLYLLFNKGTKKQGENINVDDYSLKIKKGYGENASSNSRTRCYIWYKYNNEEHVKLLDIRTFSRIQILQKLGQPLPIIVNQNGCDINYNKLPIL